jgi:AraC family transcriptional regulator
MQSEQLRYNAYTGHDGGDIGHYPEPDDTPVDADGFRLYLERGFNCVRPSAQSASYWLQLRGRSYIESKEGHFVLKPGQWFALERESAPSIGTDRRGVLIGFSADPALLADIERHWRIALLPGEGQLSRSERLTLARLWRQCAATLFAATDRFERQRAFRRLLAGVRDTQSDLALKLRHCPGRRVARQRQVFARLQRMRLFLRGNIDRLVPMAELADLTSFSPWWISKTFKAVYGDTVQSTSVALRIEHACDLLTASALSIGEISHACGFDSPCSFARTFRARIGCTASQYRINPHAKIAQV